MFMPNKRFSLPVLTIIAAFLLTGCAESIKPFAGRNLAGGEGVKLAILPFDNLSKTPGAGKTMENFVLVEFLKRTPIQIVDLGEVIAVLSDERVRLATSIPRETIQSIGGKLGVDLLMIGVLHAYEMQTLSGASGSGQVPVIALSVRIINTATGEIVWASNATRRGNDRESIFGIGRVNFLDALAESTAGEVATAFAQSLRN